MNIQFKPKHTKTIMVYASWLAAVVVNGEPDVPTRNEQYQLIVQCATKTTNIV